VVRTEAMTNVAVIAALMGPEKTRNELLSFLISMKILSNIYYR
jgi:hypothetical protein